LKAAEDVSEEGGWITEKILERAITLMEELFGSIGSRDYSLSSWHYDENSFMWEFIFRRNIGNLVIEEVKIKINEETGEIVNLKRIIRKYK